MRLGRVEDRTRYVVGFAFNESRKKVALIDKKREPLNSDMAGTFNGIGGAALARESYHAAMIREFKQETGALVTSWTLFAIVEGDDWRLFCFTADCDPFEWRQIKTLGASVTDEMVVRFSVRSVITGSISTPPNQGRARILYDDVSTLVALALSNLYEHRAVHFDRRSL